MRVEWDGRELSLSRAWGASSMELRLAERRLCVCELAAEGTDRDRLDSRKTIVTYPPPLAALHATSTILLLKLMYLPQPSPCTQQKKCMPTRNFSHAKSLSACPSVLPPLCRPYNQPACIFRYSYGPLHVHASLTFRHACRAGRQPEREGVERASSEKGLHEAFRQPCRRSALVQATDTHHSRLRAETETALQKSGHGHVRVSGGLTRHQLESAFQVEDWMRAVAERGYPWCVLSSQG